MLYYSITALGVPADSEGAERVMSLEQRVCFELPLCESSPVVVFCILHW